MAGLQVTLCLLAATFVAEATMNGLDMALLPQSEHPAQLQLFGQRVFVNTCTVNWYRVAMLGAFCEVAYNLLFSVVHSIKYAVYSINCVVLI